MSIISEALKKANDERRDSALPAPASSRVNPRRFITTACVLMLVVVPFFMPKFFNDKRFNNDAGSAAAPIAGTPPLADTAGTFEARTETGMAQMSLESGEFITAKPIYKLQGTVWTQNKGRYAILNGDVLHEGGRVGNYKVEKIGDGTITLTDGSQTLTIDKSA